MPRPSGLRAALSLVPVVAVVFAAGCSAPPDEEESGTSSEALSVDAAVHCSCSSTTSCPVIGTLAVPGHKSEPIYCNQLYGSMNPGVQGRYAWLYQCMELANRWLVDGLGAPIIPGAGAHEMCGNADRSAYDVYYGSSSHVPMPGDVLVWDGYTYGHVGVVASVSPSAITFANQNFGSGGNQYPMLTTPRSGNFFGSPWGDAGLRAKCLIHPKKLGASAPSGPCKGVSPVNDGKYCGASRQLGFAGGDPSTLYTCTGGATSSVHCSGGCVVAPAGQNDHCR